MVGPVTPLLLHYVNFIVNIYSEQQKSKVQKEYLCQILNVLSFFISVLTIYNDLKQNVHIFGEHLQEIKQLVVFIKNVLEPSVQQFLDVSGFVFSFVLQLSLVEVRHNHYLFIIHLCSTQQFLLRSQISFASEAWV